MAFTVMSRFNLDIRLVYRGSEPRRRYDITSTITNGIDYIIILFRIVAYDRNYDFYNKYCRNFYLIPDPPAGGSGNQSLQG